MKPVTPLQAENGPKMAVSYEQRCQWFQPCAERNSQRCQWFHFEAVTHPHWCHRFQARWLVGVVRWLWPHRREKVRPAGEKGRFWGVLCALGELFRVWTLMEASRANFVALVGPRCGWGGLAAVPVGGGGAWPGFKPMRRAAEQRPGPTGVEGAGGIGGPGCGARGRWRGLAGLRGDAPSEARGVGGSRAGRRPRALKAARPNKSDDPAIGGLATRVAIEKCVGFTARETVEKR